MIAPIPDTDTWDVLYHPYTVAHAAGPMTLRKVLLVHRSTCTIIPIGTTNASLLKELGPEWNERWQALIRDTINELLLRSGLTSITHIDR